MNEVYEFHLREINNDIVYFENINPTFTVMSNKNNVFYNARCDLKPNFKEFYIDCKKVIDYYKNADETSIVYNDEDYAVYYATCVPTISFLSMSHPTPSKNKTSLSVPRPCWDKYYYDEIYKNII